MFIGVKNTDSPKVKIFNQLLIPSNFIWINKEEICFSEFVLAQIIDIIVVNNSCLVWMSFCFLWSICDDHELKSLYLPNAYDVQIKVIDSIRLSSCILKLYSIRSFFSEIPHVQISKFDSLLMLVLKPQNHWMIISFLYWTLIIPFTWLWLININRFTNLELCLIVISIIANSKIWIIKCSFFNNTKIIRYFKSLYSHLSYIIIAIFMVNRSNLLCLKIDDVYVAIRHIKNNNFSVTQHLEIIYHILVAMLKYKYTFCIHMNNPLFSAWWNYIRKDEGIIKGIWEADYFLNFSLKLNLLWSRSQHDSNKYKLW